MELGGSVPHLQGLSNNQCLEANQPNHERYYLHVKLLIKTLTQVF